MKFTNDYGAKLMSFIYEDDKLIMEFLKAAQLAAPAVPTAPPTTPTAPVAPVQQTPAKASPSPLTPEEQKTQLDTARQFVKNLQTQLAGGSVFTATRDDAGVHTKDLVNLDAILNFLQFNGIKHNGRDIAIKADIATMGGMQETSEHTQYAEQLRKTVYFDYPAAPAKPIYYVNKEGLEKYLRDLQSKNNPVLNALIGKRIDDINRDLKLGIKRTLPVTNTGDMPPLKMTVVGPGAKGVATQPQAQTSELISEMINNLPLAREDIDFNRIERFLELYTRLIESNPAKAKAAMSNITTVRAAMAQALLFTDTRVFGGMTNLNATTVQYWINKQNKVTAYQAFLSALRQVVTSTANVVNDFASSFRPTGLLTPAMLDKINYQTGGGTSFEMTNVSKLDYLMRNPPPGLVGNIRR